MKDLKEIKSSLQTFIEYQPTPHDSKGKGADFDNRDWLVCNIGLNRDSNLLEKSNFECFTRDLQDIEPEGDHWQLHRFGHWACGWFEVIILNPKDSQVLDQALVHMRSLDEYLGPLNEDHYSNLEHEAFNEWVDYGISEVRNKLEDDILLEPFESKINDSEIGDCLNELEWSFMDDGSPYIDIEDHWDDIKVELQKLFDIETLSPSCNGSNRVYFFVQAFYRDIIGLDQKTLDDVFQGKNLFNHSEQIIDQFNNLKVIIKDKVWNCFVDENDGSLQALRYHV